jgi:hypothetical protein
MTNIIIYIITLIFGACCGIITVMAKLLGWTYTEACVYINLYLQYGVLMLSALSVVYVAARKLMLEVTKRRIVVLVLALLYNIPFAWLGAWLYGRYGKISCDAAFALCRDDLMALGTHLDIPTNLPYYREGWTEYFVVNILIFIVLYLLVFLVDWGAKRLIKKYA